MFPIKSTVTKYLKTIKRALSNDVSYVVTIRDTDGDLYAFVLSSHGITTRPIYSVDGVVDCNKYFLTKAELPKVLKAFHALSTRWWQIAVHDYENDEDAVYLVKKSLEVLCVMRSYGTLSKAEIAAYK